jgi:uncharacterized repeat protein (TIGR01451 family)
MAGWPGNPGRIFLVISGAVLVMVILLRFGGVASGDTPLATHDVCPVGCLYQTVQSAIDAAEPGDLIRVAAGRYSEIVNITKTITLQGGYAGPPAWQRDISVYQTVLDGSQAGAVIQVAVGDPTIDGFTITGGAADNGGGVYIRNSSPTLSHNIIVSNLAGRYGGGVYIVGVKALPTLENNQAIDNTATHGGGIFIDDHSAPSIVNNVIARNRATVDGDGIYIDYYSKPTIVNNTIVANNQVADNEGIFLYNAPSPTIINNTIVTHAYGVRSPKPQSPPVTIIWDYNNVWDCPKGCYVGVDPGPHDVSVDPRFVDPAQGDYHLRFSSPLIDAGTSSQAPATDFDGHSRPQGHGIDIGADEYETNSPSCPSPLTDFEGGLGCWGNATGAVKEVRWSASEAHSGVHSMELVMELRDESGYASGEVSAPFTETQNLAGQIVSAWVKAPPGARGNLTTTNAIHLFAQDSSGRKLYGASRSLLVGDWFQITLLITNSVPACGSMDAQFDPSAVSKIGINLAVGVGAGPAADFTGPIWIDDIFINPPAIPASDHGYDFSDQEDLRRIPRWAVDPTWGAVAWDKVDIQDGALVVDAVFDPGSEVTRKGFINLLFAPYLNLGHKDHHILSLDVRFAPSAVGQSGNHCPFTIKLGVEDKIKQKWFWSDDLNVGAGDWTRVAVDLDNLAEFNPDVDLNEKDLPTFSDIRRVGIQVYAKVPYTGQIMFDNVVIGGQELPNQYPPQTHGFVQAQGNQFVLNGEPIRFVNFNIEYIFLLREVEAAALLDAVQRLPGTKVIRSWGFADGCDNDMLANCELFSPYLQPARGVWNETAFENFDRLVAMAGERGIRLILSLANNWPEYGGAPQYVEWLQAEHPERIPSALQPGDEAYHDLFFKEEQTRQWYRDYVTTFISRSNLITGIRYADEPTIFAWELINEPRTKSDVSGKTIHDWLVEMSAYVDSLASKQMIGVGLEGWYIKPITDTEKFAIWQDFPRNYWHYGVNWRQDCAVDQNWGSNGSEFISDHASAPTTVCWNDYAGDEKGNVCRGPLHCAERAGLPHIDFANIHLYIADMESNLDRAPYRDWGFAGCLADRYHTDYFQAGEWLAQHVGDAHNVVGKPILVSELGLRVSEPYSCQFPEYIPPLTTEERQQLYRRYLQTMCQLGVNGALIWNLGYRGYPSEKSLAIFPDDPTFMTIIEEAQRWVTPAGCNLFTQFTPMITQVQPLQGNTELTTTINIQGADFAVGATAHLDQIPLTRTHWISTTRLRAVVPPGLPAGVYNFTVENPNGKNMTLPDVYTVVGLSLPKADLSIVKKDNPDPVVAGHTITYTVEITNNGPDVASSVVVTDHLSGSVTFIAATPSQGACSPAEHMITCNLGDLTIGETATITIVGAPMTIGVVTNTATTTSGTADPDTNNNSARGDTTVIQATHLAIFVSSDKWGNVSGARFTDEDILAYDTVSGVWSKYFDASDVGLILNDLDAFEILDDGILMSFARIRFFNDLGWVDDSDIVKFIPAQLGEKTAGHFERYFDGSDVGLTNRGEDIDAISFTPDGHLVISTLGSSRVPHPSGASEIAGTDQQLLVFNATSLGKQTKGAWELYFDGSAVGLAARTEDIWGLWIDPHNSDIYLVTKDHFLVDGGLSGDGNDVLICDPNSLGEETECDFSLFWDGATHQFSGAQLDGLDIGWLSQAIPTALIPQSNGVKDDEENGDIEEDGIDDDVKEGEDDIEDKLQLGFLPLIIK